MKRKYNFGTLVSQPVKNTISYLFFGKRKGAAYQQVLHCSVELCHG